MTTIIPIPLRPDALPPPKPLEASVLVVANLDRSSANLADHYARMHAAASATYLGTVGLQLENMGLIATYGDKYGPRLLLGRRAGSNPTPQLAASSRRRSRAARPSRTTTTCCRTSATLSATSPTRTCRSR